MVPWCLGGWSIDICTRYDYAPFGSKKSKRMIENGMVSMVFLSRLLCWEKSYWQRLAEQEHARTVYRCYPFLVFWMLKRLHMLMRKSKWHVQCEKHKSKANKIEQKNQEREKKQRSKVKIEWPTKKQKSTSKIKVLWLWHCPHKFSTSGSPFRLAMPPTLWSRGDQNDHQIDCPHSPFAWWSHTHLIPQKNTLSLLMNNLKLNDFPCNCCNWERS